MRRERRRAWAGPHIQIGLWTAASVVAGATVVVLYRTWVVPDVAPEDFTAFFRAGHAVFGGTSPYALHSFIYPPLFAIVLAPFSHLPFLSVFHFWAAISLISFVLAAMVTAWMSRAEVGAWQAPLLFVFCVITAFHYWPIDYELELGQSDLIVLGILTVACMATTKNRQRTSGLLVGTAGFLKAWPAAVVVYFLRRMQPGRARALAASVAVFAAIPLTALAVGGWSGLTGMVDNLYRVHDPMLPSYSALGTPRFLFTVTPFAHPMVVSNALRVLATIVFVAWVAGLLFVTLRQRQQEPAIAFWNVVGCVVLLLPLSQFVYAIYFLPILWLWAARGLAADGQERATILVVLTLLLVWWRLSAGGWNIALYRATPAWRMTLPFFLDLFALTVSVAGLEIRSRLTARRDGRQPSDDRPARLEPVLADELHPQP